MKLTCFTSAVGTACRFEETNALRSWVEYALTVVSEKFRDHEGEDAFVEITSTDGTVTYATAELTVDPIGVNRNRRYGTIILSGQEVQSAFEARMVELGVDFGPVKSTFHMKVLVGITRAVIIDTDIPVVLSARIAGEGEATTAIFIDDQLSSVSTNPVQNKVITLALDNYAVSADFASVHTAIAAFNSALQIEHAARAKYLETTSETARQYVTDAIELALNTTQRIVDETSAEYCRTLLDAHNANTFGEYDSRYQFNDTDVYVSHPELRDKFAYRVTKAAFAAHGGNTTIHVTNALKQLWNDSYDLIRFHVTNDFIHINGDERASWNASLSDAASTFAQHAQNLTARRHVSAEGKTSWNSMVSAYARHAIDADQFPSGYGKPNHVSNALRDSWNSAISGLVAHVATFGDGSHITEAERVDFDELHDEVLVHRGNGDLHVTSTEIVNWNDFDSRITAHVATITGNPHGLTPVMLDIYTSGRTDQLVETELGEAIDELVDQIAVDYDMLFRFKGVIEEIVSLPSYAYAQVGDSWKVLHDTQYTGADGVTRWISAIYIWDGGEWLRSGADVETDFSSVVTTTEAQAMLDEQLPAHASRAISGSSRPHDVLLTNFENMYVPRAVVAEARVQQYDQSLAKTQQLVDHEADHHAHDITLGQLLEKISATLYVSAGTPDAQGIADYVAGRKSTWYPMVNQMIVDSDLQVALKYKGVLGVPYAGETKTIVYGDVNVETLESVDAAKDRLAVTAITGDLYSVYDTPIMYVWGGDGQWHTIGFQIDQNSLNGSVIHSTKLQLWGRYPYEPSDPDMAYPVGTQFEYAAGHNTDNTAHHSSPWFLSWQTVRENLTNYKAIAFLPEAMDRLNGQEVAADGFIVDGSGRAGRIIGGSFVPYTDYAGQYIFKGTAGRTYSGIPATQALIAAKVATLMSGFITQGMDIKLSYTAGDTVTSTLTGDFDEGISVGPDGALYDTATGQPIVDSQGVQIYNGYHMTVTDFDTRKLRIAWNPVASIGGGLTWTPGTVQGVPSGRIDIPLYTIDRDGNEAGLLDITTITDVVADYTALVTKDGLSVGDKCWVMSVGQLFTYSPDANDTALNLVSETLDSLVALTMQPTAYVDGTTYFNREYIPDRYSRYWVTSHSRMFYFKGRGSTSNQTINNGRYQYIENAVTTLDALARVAVNRGTSKVEDPGTADAPTTQSQRFYVSSINKMFVFDYAKNHALSQNVLDAVSIRLATEDHEPYAEAELFDLGFTPSADTSVAANFIPDDLARFGWTSTDIIPTDLRRFGWYTSAANTWNTPTTKAFVREIVTGSPDAIGEGEHDVASDNIAEFFNETAAKKQDVIVPAPYSPITITRGTASNATEVKIASYKGVPQLNVYHSSPTLVSGYNGDQVMILRKTNTVVGEYVLTSEEVTENGKPIDVVYCRDGGLWYKRDNLDAGIVFERVRAGVVEFFDRYFSIGYDQMTVFDRACQSDPVSGYLWYHRTLYSPSLNRVFELVIRFQLDNTGLHDETWTVIETTDLAPATVYHGYCELNSTYNYKRGTYVSGFGPDELFQRISDGLFVVEITCTTNNRIMISAGGGHGGRWVDGQINTTKWLTNNTTYVSVVNGAISATETQRLNTDYQLIPNEQYPFHFAAAKFKNRNQVRPVYNTSIFRIPDVSSSERDALFSLVTGCVRYDAPVLTVFDYKNNQVLLYVLDDENSISPTRSNLRGVRTLGMQQSEPPLTALSYDGTRLHSKITMALQLSGSAVYPADCGVLLQIDAAVWFFKYSQRDFEFDLLASKRFQHYPMKADGTPQANLVDYTPTSIGFYCHFANGDADSNSFKLVATTDAYIHYYVVDEANHRFIDNPNCVCNMPDPRYDVSKYPQFSETSTYAQNNIVVIDSFAYRAKTNINTPGPFNQAQWDKLYETFTGTQVIARRGLYDGAIRQWTSTPVQAVFGHDDFVCTSYMQDGNLDRYQPAVLDYDGNRTDYGGRILKAKTLILCKGFRKFKVYMSNGILTSEEIEDDEGRNNDKDIFYAVCPSCNARVGVLGTAGKTYRIPCPDCGTETTINAVLEDNQ